ncbi:hypothetical protein JW823_05695 [bacterium]|nr:hypothetical protein [candidate division CSSED10-310 bacterium]
MIRMKNSLFIFFCLILAGCVQRYQIPPSNPPINPENTQQDQYPEEVTPVETMEQAETPGVTLDLSAPWVTRDELAGLLYERFFSYFPQDATTPVIIDIDSSTKQQALIAVVSANLMQVGRDHRILPEARVRKLDLARSFWRLLELAGKEPEPALLHSIDPPLDVSTAHSAWQDIIGCLAAGVLPVEPDGRFQSGRIPSGREVMESYKALENRLNTTND